MSLLEPWDLWGSQKQRSDGLMTANSATLPGSVFSDTVLVADISHTVSIYTMKITKCYKAVFHPTPLPREPVVKYLSAHHWLDTPSWEGLEKLLANL